jgi:pimeloyl-ACP methyl ester carboxylesterase
MGCRAGLPWTWRQRLGGCGGYYHFPDYVFDLDSVIRALGVERFKLIGHSMGGTISFLYSGTFPKKYGSSC